MDHDEEVDQMSLAPTNPSLEPKGLTLLRILVGLLLFLSFGYVGWGSYQLIHGEDRNVAAIDLRSRWIENRYILHGQNPYDVFWSAHRPTTEDVTLDPTIGAPQLVGYPPWTDLSSFVLVPPLPDFDDVRWTFAVICLISLGVLGVWVYRLLSTEGRVFSLLGIATVLAMTANMFTLSAGQFGIVINALILLSFLFALRGRETLSGLAFGIALIKPQITGAFLLPHVFRGNFRPIAIASGYTLLSTLAALWWIDAGPLEYFKRDFAGFADMFIGGYGFYDWIRASGGNERVWIPVLGFIGAGIEVLLLRRYRDASLWIHLAIAAVVGRLWAFHGVYDNVMLVFLPLALLHEWSANRENWCLPLAWLLVMTTLALPVPYAVHTTHVTLQVLHVASWILGLGILLRTRKSPHFSPTPSLPRR